MPILRNFARGGGKVVAQAGKGQGCMLAAVRLDPQPEGLDLAKLESIVASDRIIAVRLLQTDLTQPTIATREKSMRTRDESFPGLLLIEGLDESSVLGATGSSRLERSTDLYSQVFQL